MIIAAGYGIGDAIRILAWMYTRLDTQAEHTILVSTRDYYTGARRHEAAAVYGAFAPDNTQVVEVEEEWVLELPGSYWASVDCPEGHVRSHTMPAGPLSLPHEVMRRHLPSRFGTLIQQPFHAAQPSTTFYKQRRAAVNGLGLWPTVVVGTLEERAAEPAERPLIDTRGELRIEEAISLVSCASSVTGVESWACLLAGALGIPAHQEVDARAMRELVPIWKVLFPSITHEVTIPYDKRYPQ